MKRKRISTVEQADEAMAKLGWLRFQGHPNEAIRELWECAATYRAAIHKQAGQAKKWQERV